MELLLKRDYATRPVEWVGGDKKGFWNPNVMISLALSCLPDMRRWASNSPALAARFMTYKEKLEDCPCRQMPFQN